MNAPTQMIAVSDIERMATAVAKSGLFGIKTSEQAMALMLIAQAEGLHPAIAARDYHVIQGRPSLKADAMLARFQSAGGKVKWTEYTEQKVSGMFSHPAGGEVEVGWTIDQAKRLGFMSKDSWKNYPRAMLRARCISEGIRTVFPGVVVGVYTPEEVEDIEPRPVREMGAAEVVQTTTRITPDNVDGDKVSKAVVWFKHMIDVDDIEEHHGKAKEAWAQLNTNEQMAVHEQLGEKAKDSKRMYRNVLKIYLDYVPPEVIPQ